MEEKGEELQLIINKEMGMSVLQLQGVLYIIRLNKLASGPFPRPLRDVQSDQHLDFNLIKP